MLNKMEPIVDKSCNLKYDLSAMGYMADGLFFDNCIL
jgi:hypothetical protein